MEKIVAEAKLGAAIAAELTLGFIIGLLLLGLIPGDRMNFNVLGSVVMAAVLAGPYYLAHRYVKARQNH